MAQRQFKSTDTDSWTYRFGNGSDGALHITGDTTHTVANAGCSGTSGTTSLTLDSADSFANGDLVLIHQTRGTGAGNWELNKISSGGGTTSISLTNNLTNSYADSGASQAQIMKLKQYSSVIVDVATTLVSSTWDGSKGGILAFLCNGSTTVNGTISVNGKGFAGGAGSNNGTATQGESEVGAGGAVGSESDNANGSGGGGGKDLVGAGYGGHISMTQADLTSKFLFGGAGGGCAGQGHVGGTGGTSGGIILIISKTLTNSNSISSKGGAGSNVLGGGAAGGCVLIKGQIIDMGTSKTDVTGGVTGSFESNSDAGGSGGGATAGNFGFLQPDGGVGAIHVDYSQTFSGTATPTIDSIKDTTLNDVASSNNQSYFM